MQEESSMVARNRNNVSVHRDFAAESQKFLCPSYVGI